VRVAGAGRRVRRRVGANGTDKRVAATFRTAHAPATVRLGPSARPRRQGPQDPSIRRTWWLLSGAFLILAAIAAIRLLGSHDPLDAIPVVVVLVAVVAAIGHRNAVAGLEARGRSEAESFARILRGLSRSISADAIVAAIMDDLLDATGADHVAVVRRRQDGTALEATLVTRRAGVPTTTTVLPAADLDGPLDRTLPSVGVAVGPGLAPERDAPGVPERRVAAPVMVTTAATDDPVGRPLVRRTPPPGRDAIPGPFAGHAGELPRAPLASHAATVAIGPVGTTAAGTTAAARARRAVARTLAETAALLRDLGVPAPRPRPDPASAPVAEVIGSGFDAAVAERVAQRVRAVFGLAQTLSAPLRTEQGVIGAIVLSRRDRTPWSDAERRILRGGAAEAASALARADSHRETEAQAATDPLTGLPNRRYFDEFCGLLARRRRAGDAVAVLMIDIDRFKVLNDTYGHPVGDEVLKAVGGAIASTVRDQDVPARVGGEEFAVLLRNPGPDVALEVGERVREAVRSLDLSAFGVPLVSVSVGVANALGPDEPIPELVDRADQALLRAKRTGRNRVVAG
jgi:diguanylate cyclase (GGDEF)-like protein